MDDIILFRIAERLTLTAVILLVALVVMVGFWKTVQKLDVADGGKLGVAGSFVFSTPVFVLLAIIGYAWVSLEHPIRVGGADGTVAGEEVAAAGGAGGFVGSAPVLATAPDDDPAHALGVAVNRVRSLNCLAAAGPAPSPRVEDDLAAVKLALLRPHWQAEWGDYDAFAAWATARSTAAPDAEALAVWQGAHALC